MPSGAAYSGYQAKFSGSSGMESGGQIVDEAPTITSPDVTTFTVESAGTFTVTVTGYPTPTLSESRDVIGQPGAQLRREYGVLSGTPAPDTGGTYGLSFTASNGIGSNATQNFSLTILQAPAITSADNSTFVDGVPARSPLRPPAFRRRR